jgi:IPT/TIG domain.
MVNVQLKLIVKVTIGIQTKYGLENISSRHVMFMYVKHPFIERVHPNRGHYSGGLRVTVFGQNFFRLSVLNYVLCSFGEKVVNGTWLSDYALECITPEMTANSTDRTVQEIRISTSVDNISPTGRRKDITLFKLSFMNQTTNILSSGLDQEHMRIELMKLSTIGDIVVNKYSDIKSGEQDDIVFRITFTTLGEPVNAGPLPLIKVSNISSMYQRHISVKSLQNACCNVLISTNGIDFYGGQSFNVPFTFDDEAIVLSANPTHGSVDGGTAVDLKVSMLPYANDESNVISCIFGNISVESRVINYSTVRCIAPNFNVPATVAITLDIVEGSQQSYHTTRLASRAVFHFVSPPRISSVSPAILSHSMPLTSKLIDVYGSNFSNSEFLSCEFQVIGNNVMRGRQTHTSFNTKSDFQTESHIRCHLPVKYDEIESWISGFSVSITSNGHDWTNSMHIHIVPPHDVISIHPESGPSTGGTKVFVTGEHFQSTDKLACVFGTKMATAEFLVNKGIACVSPPVDKTDIFVDVGVTINGKDVIYLQEVQFEYYENPSIEIFEPMIASSSGGTKVTLLLHTFVVPDRPYYCRFNDTLVSANYVDNHRIACTAPPSQPNGGAIPIFVSRNQVDFSLTPMKFLFLPKTHPDLIQLYPSHGPMSGGTPVKLTGFGYMPGVVIGLTVMAQPKCRFKDVIHDAIDIANDYSYVVCKSPSMKDVGHNPRVLVDVSMTGALDDFTDVGLTFTYDEELSVVAITPDVGTALGKTLVTVTGGPFSRKYDNEYACCFGDKMVHAHWKNSYQLECVSPPLPPASSRSSEKQIISFFNNAWTQEVQSLEVTMEQRDGKRDVHTISAYHTILPYRQRQIAEIKAIGDQDYIQSVTILSDPNDSYTIDLHFTLKPTPYAAYKLFTSVDFGNHLSGSFNFLIQNDFEYKISDSIPYNASAKELKNVLGAIDDSIQNTIVKQGMEKEDGTMEWDIILMNEVTDLVVIGNGLHGEGAHINLVKISNERFVKEIQRISLHSTFGFKGYYRLTLGDSVTDKIPWWASKDEFRELLGRLHNIGVVEVEHKEVFINPNTKKYETSWTVTFLSIMGDIPLIETCCDSRANPDTQTLFSDGPFDDVEIYTKEIRQGVPNLNNDTFQLTFSHFSNTMQMTKNIDIDTSELDIIQALGDISLVNHTSVTVVKSYDNYMGAIVPSYLITFIPILENQIIVNDPDIIIGVNVFSRYQVATYNVTRSIATKEIQSLYFRSDDGIISCSDGSDYGLFSFHSLASGKEVKEIIESVQGRGGISHFGNVSVEKYSFGPRTVQMVIKFETKIFSSSALSCGEQIIVQKLANGTDRKISGGSFKLSYENYTSPSIPYNVSALMMKDILEDFPLLSDESINVTFHEQQTDNMMTWFITFRSPKVWDDVPMLKIISNDLLGHNPSIFIQKEKKESNISGDYRLKVNNIWSAPIMIGATEEMIKSCIESTTNTHVQVPSVEYDSIGGVTLQIEILNNDLPPLLVDTTNLRGSSFNVSVSTFVYGHKNPIHNNSEANSKGFRLLAPPTKSDISSSLRNVTRWLHFNETNITMREALLDAGGYKFDLEVNREGSLSDGSVKWHITYPFGFRSLGNTWSVIQTKEANNHTMDGNVNVTTSFRILVETEMFALEAFQLAYIHDEMLLGTEITRKIPLDSTADDLKKALENLHSITEVDVMSTSSINSFHNVITKKWLITFVSLKDAGDVPLLKPIISSNRANVTVTEIVKGCVNDVYLLEVPRNVIFQLRYLNKYSDMFKSDWVEQNSVKTALDTMVGNTHVIEFNVDKTLQIYILSISYDVDYETILSIDIFQQCGNHECSHSSVYAKRSSIGTIIPLGGTFSLEYSLHEHGLFDKMKKTKEISIFTDITTLESELENIAPIFNVDVSIEEDTTMRCHSVGRFGLIRTFTILFHKLRSCRVGGESHSNKESGFEDMPILRVKEDHLVGSYIPEPSLLGKNYRHSSTRIVDHEYFTRIPLEVSMNGIDFSSSRVSFTYVSLMEVEAVSPTHGFPNTELLVIGRNFLERPDLQCYFSDMTDVESYPLLKKQGVSVTYLNETHLICSVPPKPKLSSTEVIVFVATDGYLRSQTGFATFKYDSELDIHHVYPNSAPSNGNIQIVISGNYFNEFSDYSCKFGSIFVVATYVDSNRIWCLVPSIKSGLYHLTISANDKDYSSRALQFQVYDPVNIHSLSPTLGPAHNAGTRVLVSGSNFINSTSILCRFGDQVVPAQFISPEEIQCYSPPLHSNQNQLRSFYDHREHCTTSCDSNLIHYLQRHSKVVHVEVSMNGQDFSTDNLTYSYHDDIFIESLSSMRLISYAISPIFVHGTGFMNVTTLSCKVGTKNVKAHFLKSTLILCFSTPSSVHFVNNGNEHKLVIVEASNNGIDFTDFGISIEIYHPNLPGYYHPGNESTILLQCPRGAYCDNLNTRNFTLCPKGTYQSRLGSSSCKACDIGFVCPEEGLPEPRICPAGYTCDTRGIKFATQPCPPGFYCPAGTVTMNAHLALDSNAFLTSSNRHICFDNSTEDFGLQVTKYPSRVWDELRSLPLELVKDPYPFRGRFCINKSHHHFISVYYIKLQINFDQISFHLHQPLPCPEGTYCHPGTSNDKLDVGTYSSAQFCSGTNSCPTGSMTPTGIGSCPKGFYCRFGKMYNCPVGTYCPDPGLWDPLPCEPGSFNYMVGQYKCSDCPVGHFCSGYGRVDPALCLPGFVCSESRLESPNLRCPPGFYCPPGTQTSDPFRNDTTLRPYPCHPGSYCPGGVGFDTIVEGNISHAQPCSAGFYCEAASTSAKGTGICPPSFVCPKGTATPIPTQKGFYAKHPGTVMASKCLPGFYAPTIESSECLPCPPGTSCESEGQTVADICPPGTYRNLLTKDGIPCLSCPAGTWSRNWNVRDKNECLKCASGLVCPIEAMTTPCSNTDLPKPFEPVVNFNGIAVPEYKFRHDRKPPFFSVDECINLNVASGKSRPDSPSMYFGHDQYYFGELVPPYIDILGRGAYLRVTDQRSTKYGKGAKCFRNNQVKGSIIYDKFVSYFGPQEGITSGYRQTNNGKNPIFAQEPKFVINQRIEKGINNIPLHTYPRYDLSSHCRRGFSLMNSTLIKSEKQIVYTNAAHDYLGGIDVERCTVYDEVLNCLTDPTFQLHKSGECCIIKEWTSRAIYLAEDQFYPGTCEADLICMNENEQGTEAFPCRDGYICDQGTSSQSSNLMQCPAGYICDYGTTPDTALEAPSSKYKYMCVDGKYCPGGTGILSTGNYCPSGYFCPTGTSNPILGILANDATNRHLSLEQIDPFRDRKYVRYLGGDLFQLLSKHDSSCINVNEEPFQHRLVSFENYLDILEVTRERKIHQIMKPQFKCGRDHKWRHVVNALEQKECECNSLLLTAIAFFRFFKVRSHPTFISLEQSNSRTHLSSTFVITTYVCSAHIKR